MSRVDAAVLLRDFREFHEFVGGGKTCRHVLQRTRKTKSAVAHRRGDQLFHLFEFGFGWCSIFVTDDVFADLSRADKRGEVHTRALLFKALEVVIKGAPINLEIETAKETLLLLDLSFVDRSDRLTFAGDFCRHSLHDFTHRARIDEEIRFRLPQHVDKARRNDETSSVDDPRGSRA